MRAELIESLRPHYTDEQIADFVNVPVRMIKHIRPLGTFAPPASEFDTQPGDLQVRAPDYPGS